MRIRQAKMADVDRLVEIEETCFPASEAASRFSFLERIDAFKDCFYVLEINDKIVGFINGGVSDSKTILDRYYEDASFHNENASYQMIFGLDVLPKYQHQGYAKALMLHMVESAKQRKKRGLVLTCKKELISFYEQFGYINQGVSNSTHGNVVWYDMYLPLEK